MGTPPDGKAFGAAVCHILDREEQWNEWKNEGCKSLRLDDSSQSAANKHGNDAAPKAKKDGRKRLVQTGSTRKRSRPLGDQIREASGNKKFLMGNANLTKLWNLCPDNLEAASAPERDFLPSMDEYLSEAVEQLDPAQQVEEAYRKVHDGQWGWRALRLLAKKSPYFFTYGNAPIGTLPKYLTTKADVEAYQKEHSEPAKRGLAMLKKWVKEEGEGATRDEIQYILEGLKLEAAMDGVV